MSQENVEVVRRFFDAYERRDRDDVAALVHPQVEWHTMGVPLLGSEAMHGRDEALRFMFEQIGEGMDFRASLEEVTELPSDQVLAVAHYGGRGVTSGAAPALCAEPRLMGGTRPPAPARRAAGGRRGATGPS